MSATVQAEFASSAWRMIIIRPTHVVCAYNAQILLLMQGTIFFAYQKPRIISAFVIQYYNCGNRFIR